MKPKDRRTSLSPLTYLSSPTTHTQTMSYLHSVLPPTELLRMGASALNDVLIRLRSLTVEQPKSNAEFDIGRETGFIPSYPLPRLPLGFDFWERALAQAPDILSLGDDVEEEAVQKRAGGELWRQRIREVS